MSGSEVFYFSTLRPYAEEYKDVVLQLPLVLLLF